MSPCYCCFVKCSGSASKQTGDDYITCKRQSMGKYGCDYRTNQEVWTIVKAGLDLI
jgi:hypothetical protein